MRGQTLLDQSGARARHADHEHGGRVRIGRGRSRREPVGVEDRAHPIHQRKPLVGLSGRGLRERTVGSLVVHEGCLPLAAVVVDLAERKVQIALRGPVRGAVLDRGADAALVLVGPCGEALRLREVERGLGEARVECEGGPVGLAGGVEVTHGGMDDSGIVVDRGRVGLEFQGPARLRRRLLFPALFDQRPGESRPRLGIARRERHGLPQEVLGAHQLVGVQQCVTEIEVRGGVAGIVGKGGLVARDRLLPLLALLQQVAEAVVGDGDGRVPAKQAPVQIDGEVGAAGLARDGGEQVQASG